MLDSRKRKIIIVFFVVISVLIAVKRCLIVPAEVQGIDFPKHYIAAERIYNGGSPYTGEDLYLSFNYPMFVAWAHVPLVLFPNVDVAEKAWDYLNIIMVLLTALVVMFLCRPPGAGKKISPEEKIPPLKRLFENRWWVPALFLTFFFAPNTDGVRPGNIAPQGLLLVTLLGWAVIRKRETAIGVLIGLSTLIKVIPIVLIIPYIFARKWKTVGALGATLGVYLIALAVFGRLDDEWFYVTNVLPNISSRWGKISYSFPFVATRLLYAPFYKSPETMKILITIWNALMFVPYVAICWMKRDVMRSQRGEMLIFAFGTLLLPMLSPLLEYHHFNWAFPGLVCIIYLIWEGRFPRRFIIPMLTGFFFLSITGPGPIHDLLTFDRWSLMGITPLIGLYLYIVSAFLINSPELSPPEKVRDAS